MNEKYEIWIDGHEKPFEVDYVRGLGYGSKADILFKDKNKKYRFQILGYSDWNSYDKGLWANGFILPFGAKTRGEVLDCKVRKTKIGI